MTPKNVQAELERDPFVPLALHLVSGKVVKVPAPGVAWLMQTSLLVFQNVKPGKSRVSGYDVIALRNIERIEQLHRHVGA
jgi:hypothetical protein